MTYDELLDLLNATHAVLGDVLCAMETESVTFYNVHKDLLDIRDTIAGELGFDELESESES